MRATKKIN